MLSSNAIDACILDSAALPPASRSSLARAVGTRHTAILVRQDCGDESLSSIFENARSVPWPSDPDHVIEETNTKRVTRRPGGIELSDSSPLRASLEEAAQFQLGGEVIIRSGESVGRVFFANGRIAWAVASTMASTLRDDMRAASVAEQDYDEAFAECRRTGANLAETLVAWGLLGESRMRALLFDRITACIRELATWTDTRALFAPRPWEYKSNLTFSTSEVLAAAAQPARGSRLPADALDSEELTQAPDRGGQCTK